MIHSLRILIGGVLQKYNKSAHQLHCCADRPILYNLELEIMMEDILQNVSNQHRGIYFGVQLKITDVTQSIKLLETVLKENQLKVIISDMVNYYFMLESIFEEAKLPHIYQLIKSIIINFNSISALIIDKWNKAEQREANLMQAINKRQEQQNSSNKNEEVAVGNGSLLKEIRKNRLGGIHLYNQNYSKYIEDQKILEQIKIEKERRLQRKRLDLLRQSVLQQLGHKTDVELTPANNDDIASYIIQTKDKNSMLNYVSYEPELQEILEFFQKSQSEANEFLMKKMRNYGDEDGNFSFADFQRDIMQKKSQFRRQVVEKMSNFTDKYRTKEKQMEDYIAEKQNMFKQMSDKHNQRCHKEVQTDLNFSEFLQEYQNKIKDLEQTCRSFQSVSKHHFDSDGKENDLKRELVQKQTKIQKLNNTIFELQSSIESLKQLLRDQKIKKINSTRDIIFQKSQKTILDITPNQQREKQFVRTIKQINTETLSISKDGDSMQANQNMRKTQIDSNWRKKQTSNMATFLSFHDVARDKMGHQSLKPERKILLKYQTTKKSNNLATELQQEEKQTLKRIQTEKSIKLLTQQSKQKVQKTEDKIIQSQMKQSQVQAQKVTDKQNQNKIQKKLSTKQISKGQKKSTKFIDIDEKKKSTKFIDIDEKKKSAKLISQKYIESQKPVIPTSLKKIRFEEYPSRKQERIPTQKNIKEDTKPRIVTKKQQKVITDNKIIQRSSSKLDFDSNNNKLQDSEHFRQICKQNQKNLQRDEQLQKNQQQELKLNKKKQQGLYEMYQVSEEPSDWTYQQSMINSRKSSMKSIRNKQTQMMQKLNTQLKKIVKHKQLAYKHLYDLKILPQRYPIQKNQEKSGRSQGISTEGREQVRPQQKSNHKLIHLFDGLLKNQGSINQFKADKVRNWRKVILNNLRSDSISEEQVDQITAIVTGSQLIKKNVSIYQNAVSSIASISTNIRNSLPQINQITNLSIKPIAPTIKKTRMKHRFEQPSQPVKKPPKNDIIPQFQQQIDLLIKHESLQTNFAQKFTHFHKHCQEGPLCSHVTKYFDKIMRHLQQIRKKERQSIVLPVQHIGNRSKIEEQAQKISQKISEYNNRSLIVDKNSDKKNLNNKNNSQNKHRQSQEVLLPNINDHRSANTSKTKQSIIRYVI